MGSVAAQAGNGRKDLDTDISSLILAIGERRFGFDLLGFLHKTCGAEHATVFNLAHDDLLEVSAASLDGSDTAHRQVQLYLDQGHWRNDPAFSEARNQLVGTSSTLVRTDVKGLPDDILRNIVYGQTDITDRLLICGRWGDDIVGLSVLRSTRSGAFSIADIESVKSVANNVLALLVKHISLIWDTPNLSVALTTLEEIESCIKECAAHLPRREAEVCSRIIYGMSTLGISLELEISTETVMTYRKRTYHRLNIATQRELYLWYLGLWSNWQNRASCKMRGRSSYLQPDSL